MKAHSTGPLSVLFVTSTRSTITAEPTARFRPRPGHCRSSAGSDSRRTPSRGMDSSTRVTLHPWHAWASSCPPPWRAHVLCGSSLAEARLLVDAIANAREASSQGVAIAQAAAAIGLIQALGGPSLRTTPAVSRTVDLASLVTWQPSQRRSLTGPERKARPEPNVEGESRRFVRLQRVPLEHGPTDDYPRRRDALVAGRPFFARLADLVARVDLRRDDFPVDRALAFFLARPRCAPAEPGAAVRRCLSARSRRPNSCRSCSDIKRSRRGNISFSSSVA